MSKTHLNRVRGFTLVELLIVISIMAIISGLAIAVLRGAQEDALEARTLTQIQRINAFLETRWEDYEVRVLSVRLATFNDGVSPGNLTREQILNVRKRIIAEIIRVEIPHRREDVDENQIDFPAHASTDFPTMQFQTDFALYTDGSQSLTQSLQNRLPSLFRRFVRKTNNATSVNTTHQQAECLYMVMESIVDLNSSGLDVLFNDEIADTDNDGLPEILDAWGDPIRFQIGLNPNRDDGEYMEPPNVPPDPPGPIQTPIDLENIRFIIWSENIPQ